MKTEIMIRRLLHRIMVRVPRKKAIYCHVWSQHNTLAYSVRGRAYSVLGRVGVIEDPFFHVDQILPPRGLVTAGARLSGQHCLPGIGI